MVAERYPIMKVPEMIACHSYAGVAGGLHLSPRPGHEQGRSSTIHSFIRISIPPVCTQLSPIYRYPHTAASISRPSVSQSVLCLTQPIDESARFEAEADEPDARSRSCMLSLIPSPRGRSHVRMWPDGRLSVRRRDGLKHNGNASVFAGRRVG